MCENENNKCKFCNLVPTETVNTILEETPNFIVTPSLGSLVDGYVLIISKNHLYNMSELTDKEKDEYLKLIQEYRKIFQNIYGKEPIIFEHGSSDNIQNKTASSIVHAHTHIVNHNYKNENNIIKKLNFKKIDDFKTITNNHKSYIYYISPTNRQYITYDFEPISQQMRILIAEDLWVKDKYDWRKEPFAQNIISTINKIRKEKSK